MKADRLDRPFFWTPPSWTSLMHSDHFYGFGFFYFQCQVAALLSDEGLGGVVKFVDEFGHLAEQVFVEVRALEDARMFEFLDGGFGFDLLLGDFAPTRGDKRKRQTD